MFVQSAGSADSVLLELLLVFLSVAVDVESAEKHGQGSEIEDVDVQGHGLLAGADAGLVLAGVDVEVVHKQVERGQGAADDELGDLHRGQGLLEPLRDPDLEAAERVVAVHDGVDEGVEHDEDPDRRRHEPDPRPHAQHGARVVVGLQQRRRSALEEDDDGVEDLVELGQIEQIAPVGQAELFGVGPQRHRAVVADGLPETLMNAQVLSTLVEQRRNDLGRKMHERGRHADEGPHGVDAEEDVVQDDEPLERLGL